MTLTISFVLFLSISEGKPYSISKVSTFAWTAGTTRRIFHKKPSDTFPEITVVVLRTNFVWNIASTFGKQQYKFYLYSSSKAYSEASQNF